MALDKRNEAHDSHAKLRVSHKRRAKPFGFAASAEKQQDDHSQQIREDESTGLLYGLGYDHIISEKIRNMGVQDTNKHLNELVEKLGYLDLRDFIAINKFILQGRNHEENVNQAKAKLLQTAVQKMTELKNTDVINAFKKIDADFDKNQGGDIKLDYLFNNFEDSKKLFYKYYYDIKEFKNMEEQKVLDEFEKYEKMMKIKNEIKNVPKNNSDTNESQFDKYMDQIIEIYRKQRTKEIQIDIDEIAENIKQIAGDDAKNNDKLLLMVKYYAFFSKFNKFYTPTDIETEKLIVRKNLIF
jgi:hypothetical protein